MNNSGNDEPFTVNLTVEELGGLDSALHVTAVSPTEHRAEWGSMSLRSGATAVDVPARTLVILSGRPLSSEPLEPGSGAGGAGGTAAADLPQPPGGAPSSGGWMAGSAGGGNAPDWQNPAVGGTGATPPGEAVSGAPGVGGTLASGGSSGSGEAPASADLAVAPDPDAAGVEWALTDPRATRARCWPCWASRGW